MRRYDIITLYAIAIDPQIISAYPEFCLMKSLDAAIESVTSRTNFALNFIYFRRVMILCPETFKLFLPFVWHAPKFGVELREDMIFFKLRPQRQSAQDSLSVRSFVLSIDHEFSGGHFKQQCTAGQTGSSELTTTLRQREHYSCVYPCIRGCSSRHPIILLYKNLCNHGHIHCTTISSRI